MRTNIEIDDDLIARVMQWYGFKTKRDAVDYALRQLVPEPLSIEEALAMEGSGWEGDLDEMRRIDPKLQAWIDRDSDE
jgi:Arc/MetJ family transcription regulator